MVNWFPIAAGAFKLVVLAVGMFFAIKWHYDQGKKTTQQPNKTTAALLRSGGKLGAMFTLSLLGLGLGVLVLVRMLGLELTLH